jgi:hypothetical protein
MTPRTRESMLWLAVLVVMLIALVVGGLYCTRRLATFMRSGVEQGEVVE